MPRPLHIITELTFLGSEPWSVIAWYSVGGEELAHSSPEKVDTAWGDFREHGCVRQLLSEPRLGDNSHPSVSYLFQKTSSSASLDHVHMGWEGMGAGLSDVSVML